MPVSTPIDSEQLRAFVDESVRPLADRAAGVFAGIAQFLDAVRGKGLSGLLGTNDETLFRQSPWEQSDFVATFTGSPQPIVGSDSNGRALLTNVDVIALIRLAVWLDESRKANPNIGPQVAKAAVNPRF